MNYISVCSGIEAVSVAWHDIMKPRAFCEFEAFPSAVLAHHYPDVPNMGDLTKWREWPEDILADADILVGGTPCQAFSVAGLRASLADDRGNLSLEYVRLANAIDDIRHAAGRDPGIVLWENVPGVLSVRDNAFGCFLAALAGEDTPLVPTGGRWTNAGVVIGPKRKIAWRIQDAQYHGLAQRRRRLFVVASSRDGFDPAAVLFEPEGLQRYSPPRRETGQATSGSATGRSGSSGGPAVDFRHESLTGETVHTLQSKSTGGYSLNYMPGVIEPVCMAHGQANAEIRTDGGPPTLSCIHEAPIAAYAVEVSPTLRAGANKTGGDRPPGTDVDTADSLIVTHSLRAEGFDASEDSTGRGTPLVPVAYSIMPQNSGKDYKAREVEVAQPIMAGGPAAGAHPPAVAYAFQPRIARNGRGDMGEVVNAPNAQSGETGKGDAAPCVAVGFYANEGSHGSGENTEMAPTLKAHPKTSNLAAVATNMAVRRLTPVECEKLQGFPDGWTNIPWRGKPEAPDGPRYKALGNSMAVPVMRWIGIRILKALEG